MTATAAGVASYSIPGCWQCLEAAETAAADSVAGAVTPRATPSCTGAIG